ncbi:MAG: phosphate propanoyltransferase [Patescibacteria group bacterium]|jgi:putative phosphotransacetylase|nr:phosphate propanoyltransferase [Patescibacteria group bacterium]
MKTFKIKVEVSARHCHLSENDFKKLFGANASLTPLKNLSQPGEFACKEKIGIKTKKGEFSSVRIIGPLRSYTQVEISGTDAIKLGLTPPARMSGDLVKSSPITLVGPIASVNKKEAAILANRHIHASIKQAKKLGLRNGQIVKVKINGERALIFDKVKVKTNENYELSMHIDTDEANACGFKGQKGEVIV